ncbi:MAG: metalloregulator ArsR/SmtB family transcription factor [Verrucomicrobiota bacterium]
MLKTLRLIADPTRVRILNLLRNEELSVVEIQEIMGLGQSRISTHLSQLRQAKLVSDRRSGKHIIYTFGNADGKIDSRLVEALDLAASDLEEIEEDLAALKIAVKKRRDVARAYFDALAGKFGRTYIPGRSWKSMAETLLKLMPPMVIADLGAGEGTFSQLLAQKARHVIAVDNSEQMVAYGSDVAKENGFTNLEYRLGEIEDPPIEDATIDLVFFSQSLHHAAKPSQAVAAAHRILKTGGKIVILDLLKHQFEEARELYADTWLGFSELDLTRLLQDCGFSELEITVVDREVKPPNFQTLMAIATK